MIFGPRRGVWRKMEKIEIFWPEFAKKRDFLAGKSPVLPAAPWTSSGGQLFWQKK
jgi:hypothetical protein